MKRHVKISESTNSNCLRVELINERGETVVKIEFTNFIDYGDNLSHICFEWVNYELFPNGNERGIIVLNKCGN